MIRRNKKAQFFGIVDLWGVVFFIVALIAIFLLISFTVKKQEKEITKKFQNSNIPPVIINSLEVKNTNFLCKNISNSTQGIIDKNMSIVELSQLYQQIKHNLNTPNIDNDCIPFIEGEIKHQAENMGYYLDLDLVTVDSIIISSDEFNLPYRLTSTSWKPNSFEYFAPGPYSEITFKITYVKR